MYLALVPAYGRQVTTGQAAKADWKAGKDWQMPDGRYCSVRDADALKQAGYTHIELTRNGRTIGVERL